MAKMYKGNHPSAADGWADAGRFEDNDGLVWVIWTQPQRVSKDWMNYKVVADGRAKSKANYWFAFNSEQRRVAFSRDYGLLQQHKPLVHAFVASVLGIDGNKIDE